MCASLISHSLLLLISFLIKINLTCPHPAHKGSQPYNKDLPHGSLWTAHLVHLWIIQDWTVTLLKKNRRCTQCEKWPYAAHKEMVALSVVTKWWIVDDALQRQNNSCYSSARVTKDSNFQENTKTRKGCNRVSFHWSFLCVGAQTKLVPPNRW